MKCPMSNRIQTKIIFISFFIFFGRVLINAQNTIPEEDKNVKIKKSFKEFYKSQKKIDKYKILLDFENTNYYNPQKKVLKNVLMNLSKRNSDNYNKTVSFIKQNIPEIFKKDKNKLILKNINEYNEAEKNLQKLIEFLLSETPYNGNEIKKGNISMPLKGRLVSTYGEQKNTQSGNAVFEKGIKIKTDFGEGVRAVGNGVVRYSDWLYGFGKVLIIDHGKNIYTVYGYLSEVLIEMGAVVNYNQVIGKVGDSGTSLGAYLYFEIRENGKPSDPEAWFVRKIEE